jgi:hypothetical protein
MIKLSMRTIITGITIIGALIIVIMLIPMDKGQTQQASVYGIKNEAIEKKGAAAVYVEPVKSTPLKESVQLATSPVIPNGGKTKQMFFDLAIPPSCSQSKQLQGDLGLENKLGTKKIYDQFGCPPRSNIYQKMNRGTSIITSKKSTVKEFIQSFVSLFRPNHALAFDPVAGIPGLVNCRANAGVTGYFKAYFEDQAFHNNVGYDDPVYGSARRNAACQVLQDIGTLLKLDGTTITPDVLFSVSYSGNTPGGALAAASVYLNDEANLTLVQNSLLRQHILSQKDPTPSFGVFDTSIATRFDGTVSWDVDTTLNGNTFSLVTVLTHEMLHSLGFLSVINRNVTMTNLPAVHTILDGNMYKDSTLNGRFFDTITDNLQAPVGSPSPWFIANTNVYKGTKNVVGATPGNTNPVYSPNPWSPSSLSHFDMSRSGGQTYIMNPSLVTNTTRAIHDDEKEVLCQLGYQVLGITGCELPTPDAVNDASLAVSGGQVCVQPLSNDFSFSGGNLSLQGVSSINLRSGDALSYYSTQNCSGGALATPVGAQSIRVSLSTLPGQRLMRYTNKDSVSQRISDSALISVEVQDPITSCESRYNYVTQWMTQPTGNASASNLNMITVDDMGNIFTGNDISNRIEKFTSTGIPLLAWGSSGTGDGQFAGIGGITIGHSGDIYVSDIGNKRIQVFDSSGNFVTKWTTRTSYPSGAPVSPKALAVDSVGNIHVGIWGYNGQPALQKFSSNGVFIATLLNQGTGNNQTIQPAGIGIDSLDNIYIAEQGWNRIKKFSSTGTYIMQWGVRGTANGEFDTFGLSGLAVDALDNVFVADNSLLHARVQKFTSTGQYLTQWGSFGTGNSQFNYAEGLSVDSLGNVYVGEGQSGRIQKFATRCPYSTTYHLPMNNGVASYGMCSANNPASTLIGTANSCADAIPLVTDYLLNTNAAHPTCWAACPNGGTLIGQPVVSCNHLNPGLYGGQWDVSVKYTCMPAQ